MMDSNSNTKQVKRKPSLSAQKNARLANQALEVCKKISLLKNAQTVTGIYKILSIKTVSLFPLTMSKLTLVSVLSPKINRLLYVSNAIEI